MNGRSDMNSPSLKKGPMKQPVVEAIRMTLFGVRFLRARELLPWL